MPRLLVILALAALLATAAIRLDLARHREFDPDEFQHLHTAWCISHGLVPYRDFYEHHMPALPLLLDGLLPFQTAGRTLADANRVMMLARGAMWVCSLIVLALTWMLGRRLGGAPVGATAVTLLTLSVIFTGKGLEIRPDGPATALWLLSLLMLSAALERPEGRRRMFFASGLALGVAMLFTQKLLMAGPGLAAISLWSLVRRQDARRLGPRVADTLAQLAGVGVPIAALAVWFAANDAGAIFVRATLLQNLGWTMEVSAGSTLSWLATRDPVLVALGTIGLFNLAIAFYRGRSESVRVVILLGAVSLTVGLFLIPTPYPQYLLPVLPLLAICGADVLLSMNGDARRWGLAAGIFALVFCLVWARPQFMVPWVYPAAFASLALLAGSLVRGRPSWAVAVILVGASLYQMQQLRWMQGLSAERQLLGMARVHALTAGPRNTVLDGFTGYGWFRMHAWRYHFLHPGVRAQLSETDARELATGLRTGRIAPGAVLFDIQLQAMPEAVTSAIRDGFQRTDTEPVWQPSDR